MSAEYLRKEVSRACTMLDAAAERGDIHTMRVYQARLAKLESQIDATAARTEIDPMPIVYVQS